MGTKASRTARGTLGVLLVAIAFWLAPGASGIPPTGEGGLEQLERPAGCVQETSSVISVCRLARALDNPVAIAISPDGQNVYVAATGSASLSVFRRDPARGALEQLAGTAGCSSVAAQFGCKDAILLQHASAIVVSPDGQHVYVASSTEDSIAIFVRDLDSGELSQPAVPNGCIREVGGGTCLDGEAMQGLRALAFSPDGLFLYAAANKSNAIAIFSRNPGTGTLTSVGFQSSQSHLGLVRDLAISPDGRNLYALADGVNDEDVLSLWTRNAADGSLGPLGSPSCISDKGTYCVKANVLDQPEAIEVSPDGTWVGVAGFINDTFTAFRRNGDGTLSEGGCARAGIPAPCLASASITNASSLAFSPDSRHAYVGTNGPGYVTTLVAPDLQPRFLDVIGGCVSAAGGGCANEAYGLSGALTPVVSPDGRNVYVASSGEDAIVVLMRQLTPQCGDDTVRTSPGVAVAILLGCVDPNGTPVEHSITSPPLNGTLGPIDQAAGTVTYTPNAGFVGSDVFSFTASDGGVTAVPAAIRITVEADTQPPKMGIQTGRTRMNTAGRIAITVSCPADEESCSGELAARRNGVALGRRLFSELAGGSVTTLKLRLNARGRGLVLDLGSVRVQIRISARDAAGNAGVSSRKVTVLAPRR
jgi:DNA-binding beta-propeller fold protein YncE